LEENLWHALSFFNKEHALAVGQHTYKIRLKGLGKGKSGGYRAYLLVIEIENILSPLCIYAKNQKGTISFEELKWHIKKVKEEIKPLLML